jgi:hypothetical protein
MNAETAEFVAAGRRRPIILALTHGISPFF